MGKILTIQDISCVGQCSITVTLPILSACGIETCVLPTVILSAHTAFDNFTFQDFTNNFEEILESWKKNGIFFDAFHIGYLGNSKQVDLINNIISDRGHNEPLVFFDPVMADNGKLYSGKTTDFVDKLKSLVPISDYVLPNLTEACFITDTPYKENYDKNYVMELLDKLLLMGARNAIITGVSFDPDHIGIAYKNKDFEDIYLHDIISSSRHGTGDIYTSVFTGAILNKKNLKDAIVLASDFTIRSILSTLDDNSHWYGANFEKNFPYLINKIYGVD